MAKHLTALGQKVQDALGARNRQHLANAGALSQAALSRLTTDPARSDRADALRQLADELEVSPTDLLRGLAQHTDGHIALMAGQLLDIAEALEVDVAELLPEPAK